jgi:hypothetical protein
MEVQRLKQSSAAEQQRQLASAAAAEEAARAQATELQKRLRREAAEAAEAAAAATERLRDENAALHARVAALHREHEALQVDRHRPAPPPLSAWLRGGAYVRLARYVGDLLVELVRLLRERQTVEHQAMPGPLSRGTCAPADLSASRRKRGVFRGTVRRILA